MMKWEIIRLCEEFAGIARRDVPFATCTSIGVGGRIPVALYPKTLSQFVKSVVFCERKKIPFIVLGNGTNVLPPSKVESAIVFTKNLTQTGFDGRIFCECGVQASVWLKDCENRGLSGAEFLQGIPTSIGGALYMNAGAQGRYMQDIVESVVVYRNGRIWTLHKSECEYSYKNSVFMKEKMLVLGGFFRLQKATSEKVAENRKAVRERRAHLPKGKSMGCVFKNPTEGTAGELIERAGLKGLRVGGAFVSEQHANFIINDGTAVSEEVASLIQIVKRAVLEKFGVLLQEEIQYLK